MFQSASRKYTSYEVGCIEMSVIQSVRYRAIDLDFIMTV